MFTTNFTGRLKRNPSSNDIYQWAKQVEEAINSVGKQLGADPTGVFPVTPNIQAVNVTVANGIANVSITDNFPQVNPTNTRTLDYFVEFATDAGFTNIVHGEAMGPYRNKNVFIGNQVLFVRAYSQLKGSKPSDPVARVGGAVTGGGVAAPVQQPFKGSGSSTVGGQGYGLPTTSKQIPQIP